ncbi:hypothetical protein Scep_025872 [Stephania cephalantha]|uniref:Transmembrane protein n=1 Tax=Stephania cephalantha TaxID=152367 RepID=A0AAP0ERB3_9MAGN
MSVMDMKLMACFVLVVFISILSSSLAQSSSNFTRDSLDFLVQDYALRGLSRAQTGFIHEVSLPANLSGMEALVVRIRSGNFRSKGVNYTSFTIPPRVLPIPHVRRLALVFQNLGNLSSYYSLEGYSLVTPVVAFFAYDALHISSNRFKRINLIVEGDPILVHFPQIVLPEHANFTLKCVQYGVNEPAKISEMNTSNLCFTRVQGHFSIVTLMEPKIVVKKNKKEILWKCWVVGFALAFIGLVTVASVTMMMIRYLKCKKVEEMEKQSNGAEAFNYVWIGDCKMPSAATLRTQPILENREVP